MQLRPYVVGRVDSYDLISITDARSFSGKYQRREVVIRSLELVGTRGKFRGKLTPPSYSLVEKQLITGCHRAVHLQRLNDFKVQFRDALVPWDRLEIE